MKIRTQQYKREKSLLKEYSAFKKKAAMENDDSLKKGVLTHHLCTTLKVAKCIVGMCSALWDG